MADDRKAKVPDPVTPHPSDELSEKDLEQASGGIIDGVPGESTDDKHKGWIEILS